MKINLDYLEKTPLSGCELFLSVYTLKFLTMLVVLSSKSDVSLNSRARISLSMRINSSIDVMVTPCFLSINMLGDPLREIKLGDLEI